MEDFVTFELAKKLKEKGFPQRPDYFNYSSYYDWDGLRKIHSLSNASVWFDPNISKDNIYFAPTISQVLKWLRDEKKLHIELWTVGKKPIKWSHTITTLNHVGEKQGWSSGERGDSYEAAAIAGIEYTLENLI